MDTVSLSPGKITCAKCGRHFNKQQTLDRHLARKRPCDQPPELKCAKCGKEFEKHRDLHRHNNRKNPCLNVHSAEQPQKNDGPTSDANPRPGLEEENRLLKEQVRELTAKLNALRAIISQ